MVVRAPRASQGRPRVSVKSRITASGEAARPGLFVLRKIGGRYSSNEYAAPVAARGLGIVAERVFQKAVRGLRATRDNPDREIVGIMLTMDLCGRFSNEISASRVTPTRLVPRPTSVISKDWIVPSGAGPACRPANGAGSTAPTANEDTVRRQPDGGTLLKRYRMRWR